MPTVSRTFAVAPPPPAVLDYLADFSHAPQWDPGTTTCEQLGDGPVTVGTRWRNVSRLLGHEVELTYTLRERDDHHLVLVGENGSATSVDTIRVVPGPDGGSEVTYTAELEMHGLAKLADPAMKLLFEKLASDTQERLTEVLGGLPAA